jgi:pachytene checkpoint protein 2
VETSVISAPGALFDIYLLPDHREEFIADWDIVLMPERTKNFLLAYVQALKRLEPVQSSQLALCRALLLHGPPGCGKTSLARGLPAKWSLAYREPRAGLIHVNTHALAGGLRGGGHKNIRMAFQQIAEQATAGLPIFVLVDDIETLGTDRSLDRYARDLPNVVFLFTTNSPIDRAVRERVDFVVEIPLPDARYRGMILADAVRSMAAAYDVRDLLRLAMADPPPAPWAALVADTDGLSGRALRHVLVVAAALAGDSHALTPDHLLRAAALITGAEKGLATPWLPGMSTVGPFGIKRTEPQVGR